MPRTDKVFYRVPELFAAEATLFEIRGSREAPVLVLDRTIFYPEGGGQGCDLGRVGMGSAWVPVAEVTEADESDGAVVLHCLAAPADEAFVPGARLQLEVDGRRRLDHSQQHTGQHLLSSTFMRLFGAPTVSVHFGRESSIIDFDLPVPDEADIELAEDLVEEIVASNYPIRTHLCPPEDPRDFPLRRRPPEGESELRIVEIDGIDFTPCCGTHLPSTLALRAVRVLGVERYKGMTRLTFVAGGRAVEDYRWVSHNAREAARALGCSPAELGVQAAREFERRKALEYKVGGLERDRAAAEVAAWKAGRGQLGAAAGEAAAGGPIEDRPPVVVHRYADRDAASLMESAKAFAQAGALALLASLAELTVQAIAPTSSARLGEALKAPLVAAGGKGGGGPASFRAVFADRASLERFLEAASSALGGE